MIFEKNVNYQSLIGLYRNVVRIHTVTMWRETESEQVNATLQNGLTSAFKLARDLLNLDCVLSKCPQPLQGRDHSDFTERE